MNYIHCNLTLSLHNLLKVIVWELNGIFKVMISFFSYRRLRLIHYEEECVKRIKVKLSWCVATYVQLRGITNHICGREFLGLSSLLTISIYQSFCKISIQRFFPIVHQYHIHM